VARLIDPAGFAPADLAEAPTARRRAQLSLMVY